MLWHLSWKKKLFFLSGCSLFLFLVFLLLDLAFPLSTQRDYSQIIWAQDSTVLDIYLTPDDKWRLKTELPEIIPALSKAIIYKEDKYFYYHPGINPLAIFRAAFYNLIYQKKTSGASTITMQVARLLHPKRRTYGNKLKEVFQALQLEWHYSKKEILQLYLNLVPYGGNIEGVKSAAFFYFNQMPHKLSLAQIVTLSIVPNRPTSLRLGKNNAFIQKERDRWLKRFRKSGVFAEEYVNGALNEVLNAQRQDAPGKAPHLCTRLHLSHPDAHNIFTFIRPDFQEKVRQLSFDYLQRVKHLGIYNAAVLVLNNQSRQVEAYIGSADFEDKNHQGEVDGVQGVRSPGSTLKPLVYALAIDQGLLTPKRMVEDVPENFSGFEPENFYKNFQGALPVEQALTQSLNIPPVRILEKIGLVNFIDEMSRSGFRQVAAEKDRLGLSMVLGGCGVRLEELTALYGAFANAGNYLPLSYCHLDSIQENAYALISPEAAFSLTEMLSQAQRPDLPNAFENSLRRPKVAWKTGTSFGRKDAWSIGYNAHYTIGVWLGNFDGTGGHEVVGARVATPLLFEVFNAIDYDRPDDWFKMPNSLGHRWVCSESGLVPQDFCKNQVIDYYLPNVSSSHKCRHLKAVWVDESETVSYCLTCMPEKGAKKKLYPNYSPSILAFREAKGLETAKIPPHNEHCTRIFNAEGPEIISPNADKEYLIDRESPAEMQLACKATNDVEAVYWYINDQFYQKASPQQSIFFTPELGLVKISCSDDKGRNTDIQIRVMYQ